MTDQPECLICGRPALPGGDPSCDCLTHFLSRPVRPPEYGPDPADVARFPLEAHALPGPSGAPPAPAWARGAEDGGAEDGGGSYGDRGHGGEDRAGHGAPHDGAEDRGGDYSGGEEPGAGGPGGTAPEAAPLHGSYRAPHRPPASHRKPRGRTRIAVAAGGAVAAMVGSAALAASLLSGQYGRIDEIPPDDDRDDPSHALPDELPPAPEDGETPNTADTGPREAIPTPGADEEAPEGSGPPPEESASPPADVLQNGGAPTGPGAPEGSGRPAPSTTPPTPSDGPTPPGGEPGNPSPSRPGGEDPDPGGGRPELREGDRGPEVAELQRRLRQLRWVYTGPVTGVYDRGTAEAVTRFQIAYGVEGDPEGVYGPPTRAALENHTTDPPED
ncbi:peptidoglycan-binding domain-containing protein [Streptomyces sp. DSM 44917]|uniref:Peptidoglycan-binding domain-containing protein n=1 Tax=Streptomyces boetiae TaxID=3075541 RepID=A0ABU2L3D4_9ACTN|nr:peptidoglycan-binding domain-containing protein [Streptomyces sp. DSM 44917]MDT0306076.1 peptidoglycan-binding domain-containing protein [Streptomyces sp. DSM 44917]